jgi:BASS family bile acid:Na+ symporter
MTLALRLLDTLGHHATLMLAGGALFGLALPGAAETARPLLAPLVSGLLALALMRLRREEALAQLRAPLAPLLAVPWLLLGTAPLMLGVVTLAGPLDSPGVEAGMVMMAASSPITAAPAIALMMGLPLPVCLATTLLATVLVPLTAPWLLGAVLALPLSVDAGALAWRLTGVVGGGLLLALVARRMTTPEWRARNARRLDGVAVILLFAFALAIMAGVGEVLAGDPWRVVRLIGLSFVLCAGMMAATTVLFLPFGRGTALGVGYLSSSRNMGILLAALPPAAEPDIGLWFALAQFPLYMLPAMLRPLVARVAPAPGKPV